MDRWGLSSARLDFGPARIESGSFSASGGPSRRPQSRAGPFLPADAAKIRIKQFQQVTTFGPQRKFERPRYIPKVRFRTSGERRMGLGPADPGRKRVCGDLEKDLRKRRKFAAQSRFLHQTFTSNSTIRPSGRCVEVHPHGALLGLFPGGAALPGPLRPAGRGGDLRSPPEARIRPNPSLFLQRVVTFRRQVLTLTRTFDSPAIPCGCTKSGRTAPTPRVRLPFA